MVSPALVGEPAVKEPNVGARKFGVGLEDLKDGRIGLEGVYLWALSDLMDEQRKQADVGAHVKDAIVVFDRYAVSEVSLARKDLLIEVIGFILVELSDRGAVGQPIARLAGDERGAIGRDHEVGCQLFVPVGAGPVEDNGFAHVGVLFQSGFDLSGLNAIATQLDLVVGAAEELDVAVRPGSGRGPRSYTIGRQARH